MTEESKGREITGKHVLIGFVAAFALIIGVNVFMAVSAVRTFPGLEAKNGYIESQTFNSRREAQEALGWKAGLVVEDDRLVLTLSDRAGAPVEAAQIKAILGRPTHVREDRDPGFTFDGAAYVAPVELAEGNWDLRLIAVAEDGTEFRQRLKLNIDG